MNQNQNQITIENGLKLLAKSSLVVFITLFLSKIFVYLYRIIVARHYGPEVYGLFALSIMLVGWFRLFSGLGFREGLLRYVPFLRGKKQNSQIYYIYKKSFLFLVFTSIFASILLYFLSNYLALEIFSNPDLVIFLKIFSISIPFSVLSGIFLSVIRGFEKIGLFSFISNILGNAVQLAILIFLIFIGFNSNSVPLSFLLGNISIFLLAYFVSKITLSHMTSTNSIEKDNKKIFKDMISYSWPIIFYGVVSFVFYGIDSFMIGVFMTIKDVGFYNAAVPIASLLLFPLDLFKSLFLPLVTREYSSGNLESVKQLSQQVGKWIFMMCVPIFILFLVFPEIFINILFGSEYLVARNAFRLLAVASLILAIFGISQELLSVKGKSKLILFDVIIVSIINIILNYILVPLYGLNGAAFATMISIIILNFLFLIQSYRVLAVVPIRKKMFRISLVILIPTLLLLLIKELIVINIISFVLGSFFFIALYILLLLTTNCLDKHDLMILKIVKRKFF